MELLWGIGNDRLAGIFPLATTHETGHCIGFIAFREPTRTDACSAPMRDVQFRAESISCDPQSLNKTAGTWQETLCCLSTSDKAKKPTETLLARRELT